MDKFEQIGKLADAYALIQDVIKKCDPKFHTALQTIADDVADIADQIEYD
jgi:hypothetical protein